MADYYSLLEMDSRTRLYTSIGASAVVGTVGAVLCYVWFRSNDNKTDAANGHLPQNNDQQEKTKITSNGHTPLTKSVTECTSSVCLICVVGLDGAGKSALIQELGNSNAANQCLSTQQSNNARPALAMHRAEICYRFYEASDHKQSSVQQANLIVYVVDSTANESIITKAVQQLTDLLECTDDTPLLLVANKQDRPQALSPTRLRSQFAFISARKRKVRLIGCGALAKSRAACHKAIFDMTG